MGRTLLGLLLTLFYMTMSCESYGVMSVFDSSSYMLANKILTSSYHMIGEAKRIGDNLGALTTVLGKADAFDFSRLAHKLSQDTLSLRKFSETRFLVPGFETKKHDFLSLKDEFERSFSGKFNQKGYMTRQMQEKTSQRRDAFFKEAVLTSLALISCQKETVQLGLEELSSILKEVKFSHDLRSDIATTNRLLSLIVFEMIQERALCIFNI